MAIFTNPNFNFLKWRWPAVALSLLIIVRVPSQWRCKVGPHSASTSLVARC